MARARERRLARLAASRKPRPAPEEHRQALEARTAVAAVIREGLRQRGLDPDRASALSRAEAPALAGEARAPSAKPEPDPSLALFWARITALAKRFRQGEEPDLARASLAELLAWCLARPR